MRTVHLVAVLALLAPMGCRDTPDKGDDAGDPTLLTRELPFVYPPALYAARVEGEVGLRLFIDSLGLVVPESTTVAEPSGHPEFDSAAVAGARVGKTVVLPVKFRLPPADSLRRDTLPSAKR